MDKKLRGELDMMIQDMTSRIMGEDDKATRTEVNRKLLCLQDIAIVHLTIDEILEETEDLDTQIRIMDALMKVVCRIMDINGLDEDTQALAALHIFEDTRFEEHVPKLMKYRINLDSKMGEKHGRSRGKH